MNILIDFCKAVGGFFVSIPKELSRWLLRKEIANLESESLNLKHACDECHEELGRVYADYLKLKERFAESVRCILPIGVVSKIISYLPDPNAIGNKPELRIDRQFVLTGDYTKIVDEDGRWWFEIKFTRLNKVNDEKILLEVSLRNNAGYCVIDIPATKESLNSDQIRTWVWNIYESGIVALTDDIYSFIYKAGEAWHNVQRDLIYE